MKWYQGSDPNLGRPGFLCYHRGVRFYLMLKQLQPLIHDNWRDHKAFANTKLAYDACTDDKEKEVLNSIATRFFAKVKSQAITHNKRYMRTISYIRTIFSEKETGMIAAKALLQRDFTDDDFGTFNSKMHNMDIDLKDFKDFLVDHLLSDGAGESIKRHRLYSRMEPEILKVAEGADIWGDAIHWKAKKKVVFEFAAQPSTTHHVERGVKLGALAKSTGKRETNVSIHVMASNFYREFQPNEDSAKEEQDIREDEEEEEAAGGNGEEEAIIRKKRKRVGTRRRLEIMLERVELLRDKVNKNKGDLGIEEYNKREKQIKEAVTHKIESYLSQRSYVKYADLIGQSEEGERTLTVESMTGWDVAPVIQGKVTFADLRKARDQQDVIKELTARGAMLPDGYSYKELVIQLKENEYERLRALEGLRGVPNAQVKKMAKHFKIMCTERVFRFMEEE